MPSARKYEVGEYGLQEAVSEVESWKRQAGFKDKLIEDLTEQANTLQYESSLLEEENNELRDKLGMGRKDSSDRVGKPGGEKVTIRSAVQQNGQHTEKALMQVLQRELERLEEERIQLKTDNRKLAQQLGQRAAKLGLDAGDLQAIQEYTEALKNRRAGLTGLDGQNPMSVLKLHEGGLIMQKDLEEKQKEVNSMKNQLNEQKSSYKILYEENDKLRLGMHEILESIKDQDGSSDVKVSSPILENLLTILNARHLYGEYKPVMGLKAQMEKLEGVNSQLREQLRKKRLDEDKANVALHRLKKKMHLQETELNSIKKGNVIVNNPVTVVAPQQHLVPQVTTEISSGAHENIAKLNSQLIHTLDELERKTKSCKTMKNELEKFYQDYETKKHQIGILYEEHFDEKSKWSEEKQEMENKMARVEEVRDSYSAKVIEYESILADLGQSEDQTKAKIADIARKIAMLKSNEAVLTRRYKAIESQEKLLRNENFRIKEELTKLENHSIKNIGELNRSKEMNNFKMKSFQNTLEESVPMSSLETANRQYNEITAKYRDLLQKQQSHTAHSRTTEELQLQLQSNKQEKETYRKELQIAKEKIVSLDTLINSLGITKKSGQSENVLEVERLAKQASIKS